ncbi:MAG: T9SS type A sorting domain-containing protein, partial [Bacteroidetes bacterium]|nr:T9SS type A sorting domain-containing protein [Bacteroidota bacterium]
FNNLEINYVVYDQKGSQVLAGRQMVSNKSLHLNVTGLNAGLYYLMISSGEKVLRGRFYKE